LQLKPFGMYFWDTVYMHNAPVPFIVCGLQIVARFLRGFTWSWITPHCYNDFVHYAAQTRKKLTFIKTQLILLQWWNS